MRGGKFNVWKNGRKERKGSMSHEAVVKLWNARRISLEECLISVTGIEMVMQSHVEVNVRFGGDMPEGVLVDCDVEVEKLFLVGRASG